MEIRECGKASCARMGRLMNEAAVTGDTYSVGRIPLMPPYDGSDRDWSSWLAAMRAWVEWSGGDDREGVIEKAEAVVEQRKQIRQAGKA